MFIVAGGAYAASVLDIAYNGAVTSDTDVDAASTGPFVVGSEWAAGQAGNINVDLGSTSQTAGGPSSDRSDLIYIPAIDLGVDNTVTLTVTNGALEDSNVYGLWDLDNDGGASPTPEKVADIVDFVADTNGNYTTLIFKFTRAVVESETLVFTEDGATPSSANAPNFVFTATDIAAGSLTVAISGAKDGTGTDLAAPLSNTETVVKKADQLSAKVQYQTGGVGNYTDGNATSTIDVEAANARTLFVAEGAGEDTTTTTSMAKILVEDATVNEGINVAGAAFTLTLNTNQDPITGVALGPTALTEGTSDWTLSGTFAVNDLTSATSSVAGDLTITVAGTANNVLTEGSFTVTLVIDPAEAGVANQTSLNATTAFVWDVNAMVAKVPYIYLHDNTASSYLSFVKIVNEGTLAADISATAICWNVTDDTHASVASVNLTQLPATSNTTISQADLFAALGLTAGKQYHCQLTITVVAPQNTVNVSAYQKDSVGRTMVPVLYDTNNTSDGRTWQ
jgi:hypothetical protein